MVILPFASSRGTATEKPNPLNIKKVSSNIPNPLNRLR